MKHLMIICVLVGALAGCGSGENHSIATSEFQRSCTADSDCVAVFEGTLGCCGGNCPNGAVNQVGYPDYEAALAKRTPICSPAPPCAAVTNIACRAGAICASGTCVFAPLGADAADAN
jgi:hypothetical protein